MEGWRRMWRDCVAPLLSDRDLSGLLTGLLANDPRIVQGVTAVSLEPYIPGGGDRPVKCGCLFGYIGILNGLTTVNDVETFFTKLCAEIDIAAGEPAACRWILNWFDENERAIVFAELIREIKIEQDKRKTINHEDQKASGET